MTVREQLNVIRSSNLVIIRKDGAEVFSGYNAMADLGEVETAEVKRITFMPDISHKNWKEKGLMPPLKPLETPAYRFSDLELRLYYIIDI